MISIVHCKKAPYDVYIGRPGKWGNPFIVGVHGTRKGVIEQYKQWLLEHPELIEDARRELKDKVLGCWCAPHACHGDILKEIVETP